ncbi:EAL domain-containing protein [Grimontia sp. NTOU-MAR1]|uniref:EAL domain-containing protein n=1 Tax=Grimontia sp. NTOU-MAR1 TaxID=3111011 RepID=UPI002DB7D81D|nr:EAL domain-containing protein [Grimontia sp. NTOU-MAR1]WRW00010.1 EAL domain-containing protein [Grimontia sp. NTOU-MAR1]
MAWLRKHVKALSIILFSVLFAYFSQFAVSNWLVKKKIKEDVSVLSQLYSELYRQSFEQMRSLEENLLYQCDIDDVELLSEAKDENMFIEYVDLHLPNGRSCSIYNSDQAGREMISISSEDEIIFDKVSLILSDNQFEEMRLRNEQGLLRFIFQQPRNFLSSCNQCLYMVVKVNGREISLYQRNDLPYRQVYSAELDGDLNVSLYINEDGVEYLVGDLVTLFAGLVILFGVLIAVGVELNQSERKGLTGLLNEAIESNALKPFYQPIVMPHDNGYKIVGAEVLVRWRASDGEFIPPDTFIPLAEQNGSIDRITDQLIDNVLAHLNDIQVPSGFFVSVNVSPSYLEKFDTADNILGKIEAAGLDPHLLSLEITERTKFGDLNKAAVCIEALTDKGISIKLDDCGTGYGAFSYLHVLNIDTIKIDRMFVDGIGLEDFKNTILDSILAFARESKLHVVAEGVETKVQADYLIKSGVEMLQGSYFGDPVPFDVFRKLVDSDDLIETQNMALQ